MPCAMRSALCKIMVYNTLLTHLQIFSIGLSFGIAGPCFLVCTPILITYILGRGHPVGRTLLDIVVFLSGRLFAYVLLGAAAGASGAVLRQYTGSSIGFYVRPLGGIISILLGLIILVAKDQASCVCRASNNRIYDFSSLLVLGFLIGASPCPPLAALLLEIALMSKTMSEGASYAFSFGLGTFLAGFIVLGALAGLLKGAVGRLVRSQGVNRFFRVACGLLLIILGIALVFGLYGT